MPKRKVSTLLELAEMADSSNQTAALKGEVILFRKGLSISIAEARKLVQAHGGSVKMRMSSGVTRVIAA